MDSYKDIETKLENRQPFTGNSLTAIRKDTGYSVYSYNTLIAVFNYNPITSDGILLPWESVQRWVSSERYSNTTSRGQNLVRKAWGIK